MLPGPGRLSPSDALAPGDSGPVHPGLVSNTATRTLTLRNDQASLLKGQSPCNGVSELGTARSAMGRR